MKILQTLIGVDFPTVEELEERNMQEQKRAIQAVQQQSVRARGTEIYADGCLAQLRVILMPDNNCRIIVELAEEAQNKADAESVAMLLYKLNAGELKGLIQNVIIQNSDDVENREFSELLLDAWEELEVSSDDNCIKPSQALGNNL